MLRKVAVTVPLPEAIFETMETARGATGESRNGFIRSAIEAWAKSANRRATAKPDTGDKNRAPAG